MKTALHRIQRGNIFWPCKSCLFSQRIHLILDSVTISCKSWTKERIGKTKKSLIDVFVDLRKNAPSVLVLDDADEGLLTPHEVLSELINWSILLSERTADIITSHRFTLGRLRAVDCIPSYLCNYDLQVITSHSGPYRDFSWPYPRVASSRPCVATSGTFLETIKQLLIIVQLLDHYAKEYLLLIPSGRQFAKSLEGFTPRDIRQFSQKLFQTLVSGECASNSVDEKTFQVALQAFTSAALSKVSTQNRIAIEWEEIGGMYETKRILSETLDWPIRFSALFKQCTLRLRSGYAGFQNFILIGSILLYGYPGCGKTMIASAVAMRCAVNFHSVKGPEILNKYLGESEKAVNFYLFSWIPYSNRFVICLIKRDRSDLASCSSTSLTPSPQGGIIIFGSASIGTHSIRGHDHTGITDRVVNQLLTNIDGAEGLEGVYILAATSRPDLIDPALLRPGRLDKAVFCDLPSDEERSEVWKWSTILNLNVHRSLKYSLEIWTLLHRQLSRRLYKTPKVSLAPIYKDLSTTFKWYLFKGIWIEGRYFVLMKTSTRTRTSYPRAPCEMVLL